MGLTTVQRDCAACDLVTFLLIHLLTQWLDRLQLSVDFIEMQL